MKATIATALLTLAIASTALATAQYPDKIAYKGEEYSLCTNPMEPYFKEHPEKKPTGGIRSTALWRGYVATFEIKDKELLLKDVEIETAVETEDGKYDYQWKSVIETVVPEGQTLKVDWFSGILVIPYGKLVRYVHMGYGSTYSNYLLLAIRNGKLTGERRLDHEQYEAFRERQFQAFKKTEAYRKLVEELKTKDRSQKFIDSFLRSFVLDYTSEFLDEQPSDKPAAADGSQPSPESEETPTDGPADTSQPRQEESPPDSGGGTRQNPPGDKAQAEAQRQ